MNFVFLNIKIFKIIILGFYNLKMATVVAETSLQTKNFTKIFAIIFFIYNFRLKKTTNLKT